MKSVNKKIIDKLESYERLNELIKEFMDMKRELREDILDHMRGDGRIVTKDYTALVVKENIDVIDKAAMMRKVNKRVLDDIMSKRERVKLYVKKVG